MSVTIQRVKSFITISFASLAALSLIMYTPLSAFALDQSAPATTTCTPPTDTTGVGRPSGADAGTYTYNCDGYWENDYFIYTPATGNYSNKTEPTYTYNTTTGKYDYPVWVYNAPSNTYVSNTNSVANPPSGATVVGAPAPVVPSPTTATTPSTADQSISKTGANSNNQISSDGSGGQASINGTGAGSNNTISSTGRDKLTGNYATVATINNMLNSQATSGNAVVIGNTTAGDATTGNATAMANVVNLLQSATNTLGKNGNVVTFVANINGDVNGDLLLNPANLSSIQPAGSQTTGNKDLTINDSTSATINNSVKLGANSGNATAAQNTTVGNATSGNAQAVANIVNIIDSAVTSGKSFLGVININGNLNGDILLPPNFVDQLLAANVPTVSIDTTGANSNNTINNTGSNSTKINNTSNEGINNNVKASAMSGNATSSENTTAGNTTSGKANTNITAFNLTGNNVVGGSDLLVFVNVLGTWVGLIVNAPAGTTAASLGGGITQNTPSGTNSTTINKNANQQINNNIDVAAKSGDATLSQNTKAGDATSGDAKAAINLLNINHSSLSLSNWFGILFINVFGNWNGSFGVNTSAGDPIRSNSGAGNGGGVASAAGPMGSNRTFEFVPHTAPVAPSSAANSTTFSSSSTPATTGPSSTTGFTSSATSGLLGAHQVRTVAAPLSVRPTKGNAVKYSVAVSILMLAFIASDAITRYRKRTRLN